MGVDERLKEGGRGCEESGALHWGWSIGRGVRGWSIGGEHGALEEGGALAKGVVQR